MTKTLKYLHKNNTSRIAAWIKKRWVNSFVRIESLCLFSFGLSLWIKSISKIKQSSLFWHFFKISKLLPMESGSPFSRVGAKLWNEIPVSLRELPKKHLQTKLHSFLLNIFKKHDDYICANTCNPNFSKCLLNLSANIWTPVRESCWGVIQIYQGAHASCTSKWQSYMYQNS